jgi:hypothetical protein
MSTCKPIGLDLSGWTCRAGLVGLTSRRYATGIGTNQSRPSAQVYTRAHTDKRGGGWMRESKEQMRRIKENWGGCGLVVDGAMTKDWPDFDGTIEPDRRTQSRSHIASHPFISSLPAFSDSIHAPRPEGSLTLCAIHQLELARLTIQIHIPSRKWSPIQVLLPQIPPAQLPLGLGARPESPAPVRAVPHIVTHSSLSLSRSLGTCSSLGKVVSRANRTAHQV